MSPRTETPGRIARLVGAVRRREREAEEFIAVLRQAAALLQAGRGVGELWTELAGLQVPCSAPSGTLWDQTPPPSCCLHHVLRHADASHRLGEPPFRGVTGPGRPEACQRLGEQVFHGVTGPGRAASWQQLQACLDLAGQAGVAVAELLARMADALEDGQDAHQALEAATAGPRSTARLLMGMPLAGVGLSLVAGASVTELLSAPLGWMVVGTGAALTVAGQMWTRALIRTAEETA